MFTGIIETVGVVAKCDASSLLIKAEKILTGTQIGDSIAVNGVCLTVTKLTEGGFWADVMPETLSRSNLGKLTSGSPVNLERAMPVEGRIGGHIVSGHIDGTGKITKIQNDGNAVRFWIEAAPSILQIIVEKGSVAIDGISLTVASVSGTDLSVSVIPHTLGETILGSKRIGDTVNLENDIIGKYVERLLGKTTAENQAARDEKLLAWLSE